MNPDDGTYSASAVFRVREIFELHLDFVLEVYLTLTVNTICKSIPWFPTTTLSGDEKNLHRLTRMNGPNDITLSKGEVVTDKWREKAFTFMETPRVYRNRSTKRSDIEDVDFHGRKIWWPKTRGFGHFSSNWSDWRHSPVGNRNEDLGRGFKEKVFVYEAGS